MRRIAALVALLCGLAGVPADAAPTHAYLVITGSRSAVADVVIPRATTGTPGSLGWRCDEFKTTGTYAVYVLRPVTGGGPTWSGLMLPKWPFGKSPSCFTDTSDDRPLKPGRYRLYLLTDGATSLRVKLPGHTRDIAVRPTRPHPATAEYSEIPGSVSVVPAEQKRPFAMTRRTYAIQSLYVESAMPLGSESVQLCVAPSGQDCPPGIANATWTTTWGPSPASPTSPPGEYWSRMTRFQRPEWGDPPGAYDAYWRIKGIDVTKRRGAFWLQTELV